MTDLNDDGATRRRSLQNQRYETASDGSDPRDVGIEHGPEEGLLLTPAGSAAREHCAVNER